MSEEKTCYYHPEVKTRLGCSSCEKPICPQCAISASIGYICPECAEKNKPKEKPVSKRDMFFALCNATAAAIILGWLWNFLKPYGVFIILAASYLVGFAIARTITVTTKFKTTKALSIFTGIIAGVAIVYNPIVIWMALSDISLLSAIFVFTFAYISNIMNTLSVIIAVWAAVRHLRF